MRNLARIEEVLNITEHLTADQLEIAHIGGWKVVVEKGEFQINSLAVYFEVDSFLPIEERYEFLRKSCLEHNDGKDGFRIKTIKLRGQISQGLLLPLKFFPELAEKIFETGEDISDLLNVVKYDTEIRSDGIHLGGNPKGNFPNFIRKTNEPRIEDLKRYILNYKGILFEASEKIDGGSMTVFFKDDGVGVCSRNMEYRLDDDDNAFSNMAKKINIEEILKDIKLNIAIQGELAGPGIQKNRLKLNELQFFVFNVFDIDNQRYFTPKERYDFLNSIGICSKSTCIQHVPIIDYEIPIFDECDNLDKIVKRSIRNSILNPAVYLEGIVYKSYDRLFGNDIISFKALNNEYLLKNDV